MTSIGSVAGIVVAGGTGERLGAAVPKAFVEVDGTPLLVHALDTLRAGGVTDLVAVVPVGREDQATRLVGPGVVVVAGGATRTASVAAGLDVLEPRVSVVAVHDAARAFVPVQVVRAVVAALTDQAVDAPMGSGDDSDTPVVAAAPGLPVGDTLKRVGDGHVVLDTVDRRGLVGIQTPQVFHRTALEQAHEHAARTRASATDDLALVETLVAEGIVDGRVVVTPGSLQAMKVTRPDDLVVAEALARHRAREATP